MRTTRIWSMDLFDHDIILNNQWIADGLAWAEDVCWLHEVSLKELILPPRTKHSFLRAPNSLTRKHLIPKPRLGLPDQDASSPKFNQTMLQPHSPPAPKYPNTPPTPSESLYPSLLPPPLASSSFLLARPPSPLS